MGVTMKAVSLAALLFLCTSPTQAARYIEYSFGISGSYEVVYQNGSDNPADWEYETHDITGTQWFTVDMLHFDGTLSTWGCGTYATITPTTFDLDDETGCWVTFGAGAIFDPVDLTPSRFEYHIDPISSGFHYQYIIDGRYHYVGTIYGPLTSLTIRGSDKPFAFGEPLPGPEPATWATMLLGFGLVGIGLRYRNRPDRALA
jgi:hypothetical protein